MSAKRVRTLLRVSSKQQLHDDDIPIQRAEADRFIKNKKDWVFIGEYIEKAVSAYKNGVEDREVLQKILEDAKNKKFDVLLAYMSDRIGRQEEYSTYVATLNNLGIEVWTIKDGQLKTEEHIDKLLNYIRFWQNEGESKKTGMRVRDTQIEMVKSGKFIGGKAPYGYKLVPSGEISNHGRVLKKLVIVEEQAEVVRKIFDLAIHQGMGYERIAKRLNRDGISAPITEKWKNSTIASILKNPIYMGYYTIGRRKTSLNQDCKDRTEWVYSEKPVKDIIIVSELEWLRAQEIREARKNKINASKELNSKIYENEYNVPFSTKGRLSLIGLAECGYCGKRLKNGSYCNHWKLKSTGEKKTSFVGRYVCPEMDCEKSCYSQEYLESIVFDIVSIYLQKVKIKNIALEVEEVYQAKYNEQLSKLKSVEKEINAFEADIVTLEEKIPEAIRGDYYFSAEKLSQIIEQKNASLIDLKHKATTIKKELDRVMEREKILEEFAGKEPEWDKEFEKASVEEKQMLISSFIDRIIVTNNQIKMKFKICLEDFISTSNY